ncbi:hypothetical protein GGH13_005225, partial [Coemansia sp. S155-1]
EFVKLMRGDVAAAAPPAPVQPAVPGKPVAVQPVAAGKPVAAQPAVIGKPAAVEGRETADFVPISSNNHAAHAA